jgi:hypothetical protein
MILNFLFFFYNVTNKLLKFFVRKIFYNILSISLITIYPKDYNYWYYDAEL